MTEPAGGIFISYASERAALAEDIAAALAVEGHRVFLDRLLLKAGEPYRGDLSDAIAAADLFVIVVSSEIFKPESYVLTELEAAKRELVTRGLRILPVVILPVDYKRVDPVLRRLTALYPEGDVAAEVAARVHEIVRGATATSRMEIAPGLTDARLAVYRALWSLTGVLPRWGADATRSYDDMRTFGRNLRKWYFDMHGGLFLSRASYSRYAELQNALESLHADDGAAVLTAEDHASIRRLCSTLRRQLADDIGTRR
jgi:hypothetical protein